MKWTTKDSTNSCNHELTPKQLYKHLEEKDYYRVQSLDRDCSAVDRTQNGLPSWYLRFCWKHTLFTVCLLHRPFAHAHSADTCETSLLLEEWVILKPLWRRVSYREIHSAWGRIRKRFPSLSNKCHSCLPLPFQWSVNQKK